MFDMKDVKVFDFSLNSLHIINNRENRDNPDSFLDNNHTWKVYFRGVLVLVAAQKQITHQPIIFLEMFLTLKHRLANAPRPLWSRSLTLHWTSFTASRFTMISRPPRSRRASWHVSCIRLNPMMAHRVSTVTVWFPAWDNNSTSEDQRDETARKLNITQTYWEKQKRSKRQSVFQTPAPPSSSPTPARVVLLLHSLVSAQLCGKHWWKELICRQRGHQHSTPDHQQISEGQSQLL